MRLRFAPSPTGYLHVGGARTALFNWLLARRRGGAFLLRIEDTDRNRSRPEHVDAILNGLSWLGIGWDEEPVFQADGLDRHRRDALRLLETGRAYRDFTTQAEFAKARDAAVKAGTGTVARLSRQLAARVPPGESRRRAEAGEPFAVRFLVPDGTTAWHDLVHGPTRFENAQIDDFVILRSDGTPTYNLAVVSDDAAMAITHVVRGDDHISNTPKQILLYEALGETVPAFGHLPMILGPDGKRLSKRHGAQAVGAYEDEGILPEAMANFLALLGWSPGSDEELLTREEMVARFSLERVLKKGAVFDREKLWWMNGQYIARMDPGERAAALRDRLARDGIDAGEVALSPEAFQSMATALAPRSRTLTEMAAMSRPYIGPVREYDPKAARKAWYRDRQATVATLSAVRDALAATPWDADALEAALRTLAAERGIGSGKVFQPLRVALTGLSASPGIFDVLLILGRERCLRRVERAIEHIEAGD
ncbi:MAG: glutamate--tRNA ligase [Gemmatimonadetes bacterium]|nr:glutamate--tRNA ligase [Gemmatimonadota bacterium]